MTLTKKPSIAVVEAPNHCSRRRRILFLSFEFNYSPFSGNGVLCRSLVSGLLNNNNNNNNNNTDVEIRVICAKPHPSTPNLSSDIELTHKNHLACPAETTTVSSRWNAMEEIGSIWSLEGICNGIIIRW